MSDVQDILDALEGRINTVSNVGAVHDRMRFNVAWDDYLDNFKVTIGGVPQIRGWQIGVTEISGAPQRFGAVERTYRVEVLGILGIADGSNTQATFVALTESVMDALEFRTDLGLAGVVDYSVGPVGARFDERQFGSVFCHTVMLDVPVVVKKTSTYA